MEFIKKNIDRICSDSEVFENLLELNGTHCLELGCGKAKLTRQIAEGGFDRRMTATELDKIQLEKNLKIEDLPNVTFIYSYDQSKQNQ